MAKKTKKKTVKLKFPIGSDVLVYGGGLASSEFERGSEAYVDDYQDGMYLIMYDDGHNDFFLEEQLRKPNKKKKIGVGKM